MLSKKHVPESFVGARHFVLQDDAIIGARRALGVCDLTQEGSCITIRKAVQPGDTGLNEWFREIFSKRLYLTLFDRNKKAAKWQITYADFQYNLPRLSGDSANVAIESVTLKECSVSRRPLVVAKKERGVPKKVSRRRS
jgi:hypothetical protein